MLAFLAVSFPGFEPSWARCPTKKKGRSVGPIRLMPVALSDGRGYIYPSFQLLSRLDISQT